MRYILGIVCLLLVVCIAGAFFVEEGFDNSAASPTMSDAEYKTWLQTYADYVGLKSSSESTASAGSSESAGSLSPDALAILAALASGTTPAVPAKTETDLKLSYNAKSVPDGSSNSQSSPGSSNQASASNTPALAQGQAFTITVVPGSPPSVYTNPSSLLPSNNSSVPSNEDGDIAVNVGTKSSTQCPDMSQYVSKDSIPCWGCKL
jgi:hypothetical protein